MSFPRRPPLWAVLVLALALGACTSRPQPTPPGETLALSGQLALAGASPAALATAQIQARSFTTNQPVAPSVQADAEGRFTLLVPARVPLLVVAGLNGPDGLPRRLSALLATGLDRPASVTLDALSSLTAESWAPYAGQGQNPDPKAVAATQTRVAQWLAQQPQATDLRPGGSLLPDQFGQGLKAGPLADALRPLLPPPPGTPLARAHLLVADLAAGGFGLDPSGVQLADLRQVGPSGAALFAAFAQRSGYLHDFILSGRLDTVTAGSYAELADGFLEPLAEGDPQLWTIQLYGGGATVSYRRQPSAAGAVVWQATVTRPDSAAADQATITLTPSAGGYTAAALHTEGVLQRNQYGPVSFALDLQGSHFSPMVALTLQGDGQLSAGSLRADGQWTLTLQGAARPGPVWANPQALQFTGTLQADSWRFDGSLQARWGLQAGAASTATSVNGRWQATLGMLTYQGTAQAQLGADHTDLHFDGTAIQPGAPDQTLKLDEHTDAGQFRIDATLTRLGRSLALTRTESAGVTTLHATEGGAVLDVRCDSHGSSGQLRVDGVVVGYVRTSGDFIDYTDGSRDALP